jgi:hypothetical protein
VISAQVIEQLDQLHDGHLTEVELRLLTIAHLDGEPLRAGSDVVDGARLVRARLLVEEGVGAREALARARQSEGLHERTTLDDCIRISGLRSYFIDPYGFIKEEA